MIKNILEFLLFYPPFIDFLNYLPVQIRGEMTACHFPSYCGTTAVKPLSYI